MYHRSRLWGGGALIAAASFLAVQAADAQVFFTSNGGQDIMRASLDGSSVTPFFQGTGLLDGSIIDVAATSTHLYWTENVGGGGGGIWRAALDGSGTPERYISGNFAGLQFIVADQASNRVFFSDWDMGLFSANLTTGGDLTNLGNPGANTDPDVKRNTGLALAGPNQLLSVAANAGDRNIYSTDIAAGTNSILGIYTATSNQSYGMAIHSATGTVFTTTVNQGNLSAFDLGTNTAEATVVGTVSRALGIAFNPEETLLYIVSQNHGNNTGTPGIYTYDMATQQVSLWLAADASFGVAVIPEPSTYALIFGLAIGGLLVVRRRFRK